MFVKNQSRENKSAVDDRKRQCKGLRLLKQHLAGKRLIRSEAMLAKCAECMGGYADGRVDCKCPECPLYTYAPYR